MKKGSHHTEEAIEKIRVSKLGDKNPMKRPEVAAKSGASHRGQKHPSTTGNKNPSKRPEVQAKQRAWWTSERRAKQADAMRGDNSPMKRPEVAEKVAVANRGDNSSSKRPEVRAKNSAAHSGDKNPMWGKTGDKNPRWLGGLSCEPYTWEFNNELKEEVRRRDDYQCQRCGVPQSECGQKLDVHHIDYDKKNSDPVNLTALCRSCNARVNTNRLYWTTFFSDGCR